MPDKNQPNEWDVAVAALAASKEKLKLRRGASTSAQRAVMKNAMQNVAAARYVVAELLEDEQYGVIAEDGVYADPQNELQMLRQARFMLDHAIETMEATDWCLEPAEQTKPR